MAEVFTIFFFLSLDGMLQPVHLLSDRTWWQIRCHRSWCGTEPGVLTHKPRGRKSNFFDGGVFGAILYQVSSSHAGSWCLWLGLALSEHATRRNPCERFDHGICNSWFDQLLHAFNVKSVLPIHLKNWDSLRTRPSPTGRFQLPLFLMATIIVLVNKLFHVSHLSLTQYGGSLLIVVLVEIVKAVQRALGKNKNAI